ncbi:MAG: radical SAM protein, partial [Bifidobacteriaceae bacterium]|nr:radical SAM protein [Bifidobacteriaceae bacterium]
MHRHNGSFGRSLHYAPLTLTTLAALVPDELGAELAIYDESAGPVPLDLEADLVCMTVITGTSQRVYRYADYFRSRGLTVVIGGVHASLLPDEVQRHADSVVIGFAEQTFPALLRDFRDGRLAPRYWQGADYTIAGRPLPRRELLDRRRYITLNSIEAVRGCTLRCTFCAYPAAFGRKLHPRPVEEVVAEIVAMRAKYVVFPDVNLIAQKSYARRLFAAIAPLKIWWGGLVTSAIGLDDDLLKLFQRSGCKALLIGYESVAQESQAYMSKGVNRVVDYEGLVRRLHDHGILLQACFAFGADNEDRSIFERTVEVVQRTKIDLPRYSILTPFPQTAYYRQLEAQSRIIERDWAMYDVEHVVYRPALMTPDELLEGTAWAWRETYKATRIAQRLLPSPFRTAIGTPLNLGYKGYAEKFLRFTREVMCDNSDIPQPGAPPPPLAALPAPAALPRAADAVQ